MPDFPSLSIATNLAVFAVAAAAVWTAGTRLAAHADVIARATGLGQAVIGMMLLGGITSLPEIAVSVTAGLAADPTLAVNNILGGVALQVAIIAIGDAVLKDHAITSLVRKPIVMLQAAFSCLLLTLVLGAIVVGDVGVAGVGVWSIAVLAAGIAMFWRVARTAGRDGWAPTRAADADAGDADSNSGSDGLRTAIFGAATTGVVVLVAGYVLARTGEAIAHQTGLGTGFVGAILVGLATSLPEISTVIAAARLRRYTMAFADIFGTNMFDIMLIFLIDAVHRGPPVLATQGRFAAFAALLGIVLTLMYVVGLIERRDDARMRLGTDSWSVVLLYVCGAGALYFLR
ncbi:sodium:calcium antiporter [Lysobacter korlensis]|uniref:Sodium:calcium antiporter n=1 Tax=Lysobacter korlensis TaxID=553636 RepID=A0ABV6RLD1_9GAMM